MATNIYKQVENYVSELFELNQKPKLIFHSFEHTRNIVKRTEEIAAHYKLSEREMLALYIAAWFHDTGHLFTSPDKHEEKSVELMRAFLQNHLPDQELTKMIENCIMVTKRNQEPTSLLEQIICDADTYHLGTKDFRKTNKQVRKEVAQDTTNSVTKKEWDLHTLEFLEKHKYYTSYCQELLNKGKQENIDKLREKTLQATINQDDKSIFGLDKKNDQNQGKQANALVSKGIQTMLRLTSGNHLKLSEMADSKANILISVNAIIISISINFVFKNFESDTKLIIPTIIFLCFAVITITLSILATRPNVTSGHFSKEDITNKKTNLLFFGNFYKTTLDDYKWGMSVMMRDPEYLYGSVIKDIYYLGVVLGRKYKLLRLAYTIFMIGIVVTVLAFIITIFFTKSPVQTPVITNPTNSPI
jgi:predicted metal-dependent HD superfamily phosphohydrolase